MLLGQTWDDAEKVTNILRRSVRCGAPKPKETIVVKRRRGLGRGLGELLAATKSPAVIQEGDVAQALAPDQSTAHDVLQALSVDVLQSGQYQPRRNMKLSALEDLADSIRARGIIQPIVVRAISPGRYEIIAGERRWRAAQMAGLSQIPVIVKDFTDEETLAVSLIENIQREDLNPIEEAIALQRLVEEFSLTHQQVAEAVGRSRTAVTNLLRLLALHSEVRTLVESGGLEMGHGRALLALGASQQLSAARTVVEKGFSVRETERLVAKLQKQADKTYSPPSIDPDVRQLQKSLSETLGVAVEIRHGSKGRGRLVIPYHSVDELDGILEHIK